MKKKRKEKNRNKKLDLADWLMGGHAFKRSIRWRDRGRDGVRGWRRTRGRRRHTYPRLQSKQAGQSAISQTEQRPSHIITTHNNRNNGSNPFNIFGLLDNFWLMQAMRDISSLRICKRPTPLGLRQLKISKNWRRNMSLNLVDHSGTGGFSIITTFRLLLFNCWSMCSS